MRESKVSISCIIPAYNVEKYISACLDSILQQEIENIEIICVDDGSTDNTGEIIKQYEKIHPEIKTVFQKHSNAGDARNRGLDHTTGKYIHFMDADDIVTAGVYKKIYDLAEDLGADYIKGRAHIQDIETGMISDDPYFSLKGIDPDLFGREISIEDNLNLFLFSARAPWMGIYRREFIRSHGLRFLPLKCTNDRAFYETLLCSKPKTALYDGFIATHKVNNKNSLSGSRNRPENFCFYVEHMNTIPVLLNAASDYMRRMILSNEMFTFAREFFASVEETQTRYKEAVADQMIPLYYDALTAEMKRDIYVRRMMFYTGYLKEFEIDSFKKLDEIISQFKNIAIYGYGKMAGFLLKYLSDVGLSDRVLVCVLTDPDQNIPQDTEDMKFISVRKYKACFDKLPILVTTSETYQVEIIEEIRNNDIRSEVFVMTDGFLSEMERLICKR